ncbi:MAG: glycosyltransferase [Gemmatimonadota bacterium]|nr:glycosyltransferase [Gemmatimonadota bacterium]
MPPARRACVTLLSDDSYLPGTIALGESLRRRDWPHATVVLVTGDVSPRVRDALHPWWDEVEEVELLPPASSDGLWLEQFATVYTKLHVWRLERFEKVLYVDSDAIAVGPLEEALERSRFAAAPCVTTPDTFNTGVLVLEPDEAVFRDMRSRLEGWLDDVGFADQAFLNAYFPDWYEGPAEHRLPFTYNVNHALYHVPPAWERLRDDWRVLHFPGPRKPWSLPWGWPVRALHAVLARRGWRADGPSPMALWWEVWNDALRHAPDAARVAGLRKSRGWSF